MKTINISIVLYFLVGSLLVSGQVASDLNYKVEKRVALVIGNGNYRGAPLANPENDARSMAETLQEIGFMVYEYENLTSGQMKKAIDDFGMELTNYDVGLFYYAGHGIQSKGYNYLIPVDADLKTEIQLEYDCVRADRVLAFMEEAKTKVKIIILDACRDNPFERTWTRSATGRGLATMNAPSGTLIAYSTAPGKTASDGSGKNGLYTSALLENLVTPDITILQMFQNIRSYVVNKSGGQQTPWESTSLIGDFYFNQNKPIVSRNDNIADNQIQPKEAKARSDTASKDYEDALLAKLGAFEEYIILKEGFTDARDGNHYNAVKIGNQIWMAENPKYLPDVVGPATGSATTPYYYVYGYKGTDVNAAKATANYRIYGVLYNWPAAMAGSAGSSANPSGVQGVCPTGWHLPDDAEWTQLTDYLGGAAIAGGKLKEAGRSHWTSPNTGATNKTGFTALPGGFLNFNGRFYGIRRHGDWWSATEDDTSFAWCRYMDRDSGDVRRNYNSKEVGVSVRCIKD